MIRPGYFLYIIAVLVILTTGGCAVQHDPVQPDQQESETGEDEPTGADSNLETGAGPESPPETGDPAQGNTGETAPAAEGEVEIEGLGVYKFSPEEVKTVREDIFREGYFSIFDILVHLADRGDIEIDYHFDEEVNTHVITDLGGFDNWWYKAHYDGGWRERSVFRMDHYPYKDAMTLSFARMPEEYLAAIDQTYREEVLRRISNGGKVIVPEVIIELKDETLVFENYEVKAHNLREDMFQPGTVTAIDTILTLAGEGKISYDLQWYESLGSAGVVKSYWVNRINDDESVGRCGFVYEAGNWEFEFFRGNHNHIPSDARVINSPEYVIYFWICI